MDLVTLSDQQFLRHCKRAYVVSYEGGYDDHAEVVFARNPMEARRLFAESEGHDFEYCTARRAAEFDECHTTDELRKAQLAAGWWFTCGHCERHVSDDATVEDDLGRETELEPYLGSFGDVYCSGWCAGAEAVRHVERRIRIWEALEAFADKFPGAVVDSVCTYLHGPLVTFKVDELPGVWIGWTVGTATIELAPELVPGWQRYLVRRDALRSQAFLTCARAGGSVDRVGKEGQSR